MKLCHFARFLILPVCCCLLIMSCKDDDPSKPSGRTYEMGFQNSAPRVDDINLILEVLDIWTPRADAAIIVTEVPWKALLDGQDARDYVMGHFKGLVDFYRSKDLSLWVYVDPQNGLDRTSDATELVALGKSIAQPEMQQIYRRFVVVMDSILKPDHMGLALETNLIRTAATPAIYQGVKNAANDAASDLVARGTTARLSVSFQVDHAWGKLVPGAMEDVDQDYVDFPFIQEVGLSSYPYFGFEDPNDIPLDYYSRLLEGKDLPAFVAEGGWSSEPIVIGNQTIQQSPETQRQYIEYHPKLLERIDATGWFQLPFTDIDLDAMPPGTPPNLKYFAFMGMVDVNLNAKPALDEWDEIFKKELDK